MPTSVEVSQIGVEDSLEALLSEHRTTSTMIYLVTLATTIAGLGTAALTSVDLTIRAPATLAPSIDRQTLRSLADGTVDRVYVVTGSKVRAGDTLITLVTTTASLARIAAENALAAQMQRRGDMKSLLHASLDTPQPLLPPLVLQQSQAAASAAIVEWKQRSVQVVRAERARDRLSRLLAKGFATVAELEAIDLELESAQEERALALERRRVSWTETLADAEQQIVDLQGILAARNSDLAARYITAPLQGTIGELMPLSTGSVVRAGDPLVTISPDGPLIADALVAPRDVGYVRKGMPARLLIDGYDVQEWGTAEAVVTMVAQDYTLADGHPVFHVRLQPLHPLLKRANGSVAPLGKGFHCQVRFLIGRKRITELIWQRASEWLDPVSHTER